MSRILVENKFEINEVTTIIQKARKNKFDFEKEILSFKARKNKALDFKRKVDGMSHTERKAQFLALFDNFKKINFKFPNFEKMIQTFQEEEGKIRGILKYIADPSKDLLKKFLILKQLKGLRMHKSVNTNQLVLNKIFFNFKEKFLQFEVEGQRQERMQEFLA